MTNNAAERQLRGVALGRKAWMFAGSNRGGERAAAMSSLIATARLNDVDPCAWLADVLAGIADHRTSRPSASRQGAGASSGRFSLIRRMTALNAMSDSGVMRRALGKINASRASAAS